KIFQLSGMEINLRILAIVVDSSRYDNALSFREGFGEDTVEARACGILHKVNVMDKKKFSHRGNTYIQYTWSGSNKLREDIIRYRSYRTPNEKYYGEVSSLWLPRGMGEYNLPEPPLRG